MNAKEKINQIWDSWAMGFNSAEECLYRIVDAWTIECGGNATASDMADMIDYVEEIGWDWMGRYLHGYIFGAPTDDEWEEKGEALRKDMTI